MIFSKTPHNLYRSVIGDQLTDTSDLDALTFVIDNYTLISYQSEDDIKEYFGHAWDLWVHGNNSKLLITFLQEVCSEGKKDYVDHLDKVVSFCKKYNVPGTKIVIFAANNQSKENMLDYLVNQIPGVSISGLDFSEYNTVRHFAERNHSQLDIEPTEERKKFVFFSRHYKSWRHYLVGRLYLEDLLKECNFSFYNIDPYKADESGQPTTWPDDWLIKQLKIIDAPLGEDLIESGFYGSLPFRLPGNGNIYDINADESTNTAYANSHISVTIETLFDYGESDFHTTEKTFKPIVYKKPFIMFSSHLFLKNLRKMGYATFHPYIDETYDTIEDPKLRADAVIAEMQRISNLSEEEFDQLMASCQERVEWNFNRLNRRYDNFYYGINIDPYIEWTMYKQR